MNQQKQTTEPIRMTVNQKVMRTAQFTQGSFKLRLGVAFMGERKNTWDPEAKGKNEQAIVFVVYSRDDLEAKKPMKDVRKCEIACGTSFGHPKSGLTRFVNEVLARPLTAAEAETFSVTDFAASHPDFEGMMRVDEDSYGGTINTFVGVVNDPKRKPVDVAPFLTLTPAPSVATAVEDPYDPFA